MASRTKSTARPEAIPRPIDRLSTAYADDFVEHQVFPGTTPDKKGALDSYRLFFEASPDMTAEIHDLVAAGTVLR